jgi:hypothetical protein
VDFTHTLVIALLVALGISQAVSFALQARTLQRIHDESNGTLAATRATLDAAIRILVTVQEDHAALRPIPGVTSIRGSNEGADW